MLKVAVIGNTTWGNTLAALLASKGIQVKLWQRKEGDRAVCPGRRYSFTCDAEEVIDEVDMVIWAVPSQYMRENVRLFKDSLDSSMLLVTAAKGIELDSGKRMSQVIAEEISSDLRHAVCALSGPNLAGEIARELPAASVVASRDISVARRAQEIIIAPGFQVFASDDIVGVELGGALKNVIALGAGVVDGLKLGDNAKAAFLTWGWAEVVSLGEALGAKRETFYGLSGLGDLMATCAGNLSRNHRVGYEVGKGKSLFQATSSLHQVVEGVHTIKAISPLARGLGLDLPVINLIHGVLFEDLPVAEVASMFGGLEGQRSPDYS